VKTTYVHYTYAIRSGDVTIE